MLGTSGQKATTIDQAIDFIGEFIRFEHEHVGQINTDKNHDFDLYLPWMMEIVNNAPEEEGSRTPLELDSLYMEAAWALVVDGRFRPGAKNVSGENPADAYGKGYSLTPKGRKWIEEP